MLTKENRCPENYLQCQKGFGNCISVQRDYLNTHWENHATYAQWNTLKDWKRFLWPKSLVAKEMQIKMTIWYPSIPSRVTIITEQVEKGKTGNTKSCSYHGTVLIFLPKAQQSCQVNLQFHYWALKASGHMKVYTCVNSTIHVVKRGSGKNIHQLINKY